MQNSRPISGNPKLFQGQLTLALFRDNPIVLAVLEFGELAQIQASLSANSVQVLEEIFVAQRFH